MKALIVLIVLAGLALGVMYMFGGYDENPKEQAANFKASVKPGMDWQQVIALHRPSKYQPIWMREDGTPREAAKEDFNEQQFKDLMAKNYFSGGFLFPYTFTTEDVVHVYFDPSGVVSHVTEPMTEGDILSGKAIGY